jgi:hypothetical protein
MTKALTTLKTIRQNAPGQDRNEPALVAKDAPHWTTGRDGSRYVAFSLYPRTLDELRTMSRGYGEAAVAEARWCAVGLWLMKAYPSLANPYPVAQTAIEMMREHDRYHLGWPHHDGKAWPTPVLDGLSLDCQREARLVAAETYADWQKAGSPWIDARHIKAAYQLLTSSPAFINKYIGPDHGTANNQENQ